MASPSPYGFKVSKVVNVTKAMELQNELMNLEHQILHNECSDAQRWADRKLRKLLEQSKK